MTKIYAKYTDFLCRDDKEINGVSPSFAEENSDYEEDNENNKGCWNCSGCSDCSDCSGCSDLEYKSDRKEEKNEATPLYENVMGNYPVIENIHQKVFEAATARPDALNMGDWHTCETTHCRAGWVVQLAGEAGAKLERQTSTLFAAMQIYKASSRHCKVRLSINSLRPEKPCSQNINSFSNRK